MNPLTLAKEKKGKKETKEAKDKLKKEEKQLTEEGTGIVTQLVVQVSQNVAKQINALVTIAIEIDYGFTTYQSGSDSIEISDFHSEKVYCQKTFNLLSTATAKNIFYDPGANSTVPNTENLCTVIFKSLADIVEDDELFWNPTFGGKSGASIFYGGVQLYTCISGKVTKQIFSYLENDNGWGVTQQAFGTGDTSVIVIFVRIVMGETENDTVKAHMNTNYLSSLITDCVVGNQELQIIEETDNLNIYAQAAFEDAATLFATISTQSISAQINSNIPSIVDFILFYVSWVPTSTVISLKDDSQLLTFNLLSQLGNQFQNMYISSLLGISKDSQSGSVWSEVIQYTFMAVMTIFMFLPK